MGIFDYRASWTGLDHRFTSSSEGYEEIPYVPDHQIELLQREDDERLNSDFSKLPAEERLTATRELMHKDIHRH